MPRNSEDIILSYLHKVKTANKEMTRKEAFKDMLNRLYAGNREIEAIIDKISGGAEATILDGSIFQRLNISNFIDNDFFHWVVAERNFYGLKKVFRLVAQEISAYDFNNGDVRHPGYFNPTLQIKTL